MDPNINNQNKHTNLSTPEAPAQDPVKDEKYAQALLQMTNMQYQMDQDGKQKKPLISTKKLVYIIASIVVTIISFFLTPALFKSDKGTSSKDNTNKLLNDSNYVKDLTK